jgi:hypothetical protein
MNILDDVVHDIKMAFVLFANAFLGQPRVQIDEKTLAISSHNRLAMEAGNSRSTGQQPGKPPVE